MPNLRDEQETLDRLDLLRQVEAGLREHVSWLLQVNRLLVCGEPASEDDVRRDAHLYCAFGRWLQRDLCGQPGMESTYQTLAGLHRQLHGQVCECLMRQREGHRLDAAAYEALSDSAMRFSNGLRLLRGQIAAEMRRPPEVAVNPG